MSTFQLSPGVNFTEKNLTGIIPAVSTTDAALAGPFLWGPLNERVLVEDESKLVARFGEPDYDTATTWFSASNFLQYGSKLRVVRVAHTAQAQTTLVDKLGVATGDKTVTLTMTSHGLVDGDEITISGVLAACEGVPASELNGVHVVDSTGDNTCTFEVLTEATGTDTTVGGTFVVSIGECALNATSEKYTGSALVGEGILIENDDSYEHDYDQGQADVGLWAAKYPGVLGNSLEVSFVSSSSAFSQALTVTTSGTAMTGSGQTFLSKIEPGTIIISASGEERTVVTVTSDNAATISAAFTADLSTAAVTAKWKYWNSFRIAPGTSDYTAGKSGLNDGMHLIVVDAGGEFTGVAGTVLEKFTLCSLAADAVNASGDSIYYKTVVDRQSLYIRWMDKLQAGTNWGSNATSTTFTAVTKPYTFRLAGGHDGNSTVTTADKMAGYDYFLDSDVVDVSLVIAGEADSTLSSYLIGSLAEVRKDCVVFLSPEYDDVVDNAGDEVTDEIAFRNALSPASSSYYFLANNWKWQYDRYNDVYRWLPLCGDIAGLAARTDLLKDPWWSFAGLNRGHIKNVYKLAYQPTKSQRDDLYVNNINPVFTKPGQGTVLFGDKTGLSQPSAFDRVNVRRLFIVIEKAISIASYFMLFEFNNSTTRARFVAMVDPYLADIKGREGISNFKVIADESNNTDAVISRNEFIGDIYIKPAYSINSIQLNFIAVGQNVTFEETIGGTANIF